MADAPLVTREEFERDSKGQTGEDLAARTHYIPYFTRLGAGDTQQAACGAMIDPSCHSAEPSCWGCRAWIDNDDKSTADLTHPERNE